jgi:hypothetical protein
MSVSFRLPEALATSRCPFLSQPEQLARILLQL